MQSTIMRLEIIFASVLPVSAVLVVGTIGIEQMIHVDARVFLISILICAFIVFFGEMIVIQILQRATRAQFTELIDTCHEYIAGNRERRVTLSGDNALTTLATTINNLLDTTSGAEQEQNKIASDADTVDSLQLSKQVQNLIRDIKPVTEGDLRVTIEVPQGNIGIIADICYALIEELADQVRWTRYSSEQVIGAAATILHGTIELAQTVEMQMLRFSETTAVVEKLVAFIQRLSNTLQVSVEMSQDLRGHLQQQIDLVAQTEEAPHEGTSSSEFTRQSHILAMQLNDNIERQVQLLEEVSRSTQSHTALGETMITDFYTFAQRIHQSSTGILQTAEHINEMAQLARRWQDAVMVFQLREEEPQELT